jgi:parallel beta-helix repeat protein
LKATRLAPVLAVAGALAASPAAAVTRCVKPTPSPTCFQTIQDAINAAGPGDVVSIAAGIYFENVTIPSGKDGLVVQGASKLATVIDPDLPGAGNAFTIQSPGVQVRNLGVRNGRTHGITIDGGVLDVTVKGVRIVGLRDPSSTGILASGGNDGLQLLGNEIRGVRSTGIVVATSASVVVAGNTVSQTPTAMRIDSSSARVTANKVSGCVNGIRVVGDGNVVSGNLQGQMDGTGLDVVGINPTVQGNKLTRGGQALINCTACSGGAVTGNSSVGSNRAGFQINADGAGLVVSGNKVTWSAFGFSVQGTGIEFVGNSVADTGVTDGSLFGGACIDMLGNGHAVERNVATRCAGSSFVVFADNAVLDANSATSAGVSGFMVTSNETAGVALTGNKAFSSNAAGFAVTSAAAGTQLNGNVASKNRYGFCDDGIGTTATGNNFGTPAVSTFCDVTQ